MKRDNKPAKKLKRILGRRFWTRKPATQVAPDRKKRLDRNRCRSGPDPEGE